MIITWTLVILTMICGVGGAVFAILECETKAGKIGIAIVSIIVAICVSGLLFWHLYYTESGKRAQKTFHSEVSGGLYRIVKVYDMQGEQIAEYKGKFDIEENQMDGVTKIKFDLGGERHIIYCSTGTVIIDEIPTSKGSDDE